LVNAIETVLVVFGCAGASSALSLSGRGVKYVTLAAGCRIDSNSRTRIIRCNVVALLAGSTTIALSKLGCVLGLRLLGATLIPILGVAATVVRDLAGEDGGD